MSCWTSLRTPLREPTWQFLEATSTTDAPPRCINLSLLRDSRMPMTCFTRIRSDLPPMAIKKTALIQAHLGRTPLTSSSSRVGRRMWDGQASRRWRNFSKSLFFISFCVWLLFSSVSPSTASRSHSRITLQWSLTCSSRVSWSLDFRMFLWMPIARSRCGWQRHWRRRGGGRGGGGRWKWLWLVGARQEEAAGGDRQQHHQEHHFLEGEDDDAQRKGIQRKTPISRRIFASGLASKLQNSQELGSPSKSWSRLAKCKVDNKTCGIVQIEIAFSVCWKALLLGKLETF